MPTYIVVGCFIIFDVITGIIKALYKKEINSTMLRVGLFHKITEILATIGSGLLEYGAGYVDIDFSFPLLKCVALYIVIMEFTSIIENLCVVNPTLNKLFSPYLEKLKNKGDKEEK